MPRLMRDRGDDVATLSHSPHGPRRGGIAQHESFQARNERVRHMSAHRSFRRSQSFASFVGQCTGASRRREPDSNRPPIRRHGDAPRPLRRASLHPQIPQVTTTTSFARFFLLRAGDGLRIARTPLLKCAKSPPARAEIALFLSRAAASRLTSSRGAHATARPAPGPIIASSKARSPAPNSPPAALFATTRCSRERLLAPPLPFLFRPPRTRR